jgi:hypothetical protein
MGIESTLVARGVRLGLTLRDRKPVRKAVQEWLIASSVKISGAVLCVCEDRDTNAARVPEQANVSAIRVA